MAPLSRRSDSHSDSKVIQSIVFDLDDTLLDTTGLLIPIAKTPAFEQRIQQSLPLMPGALENLNSLQKMQIQLFLLTQGREHFQKMKIQSLALEGYFLKVCIVDGVQQTKRHGFEVLIQQHKLIPQRTLSIGNRRSTDLRFAKQLGMFTCLFHYGEHKDEEVFCPEDQEDLRIEDHFQLLPALKSSNFIA
jgi:FMN phosphatase YigB (HAD superfamily)